MSGDPLNEWRNPVMTQHEYDFLTSRWDGPKGAAYNQVFEFCKEFGWLRGFSARGEPIPTEKGSLAIKDYKENKLRKEKNSS